MHMYTRSNTIFSKSTLYALLLSVFLVVMAIIISGGVTHFGDSVLASDNCGCEGKVTQLTLKYLGSSAATVRILAKQGSDTDEGFNSVVQPSGVFTIVGLPSSSAGFDGTLGTEIDIYVNGTYHTTIHTSCSQPIGPGLISGDFLVVAGESKIGGTLPSIDTGMCEPPPPQPPTPTCTLTINPNTITEGDSATILWTSTNASLGTLDNSVGNLSPVAAGSTVVSPIVTTTYVATFTGDGGTVLCNVTITVELEPPSPPPPLPPPAPTCTLTINPSTITAGNSVTLSWTSTNADTGSIDNDIGSISPFSSGSVSVTPSVGTTYAALFTGAGGTVQCSASIVVEGTPPPPPPPLPPPPGCQTNCGGGTPAPTCTLDANPKTIQAGGSSKLEWSSGNASIGKLDQGIGDLVPVGGGEVTASPTTSTLYSATFWRGNDSIFCTATITVEGTPPPPSCVTNCGGGSDSPTVTLTKRKVPNEQPLAFVYLSQIPYTGFGGGSSTTTALFLTLLVIWSGLVSYAFVVKKMGRKLLNAAVSFAQGTTFEKAAAENTNMAPIEEIPSIAALNNDETSHTGIEQQLEERAHAAGVLISHEGIQLLLKSSHFKDEQALGILSAIIKKATNIFPREDGWIHLNKDRVLTLLSPEEKASPTVAPREEASSYDPTVLREGASAHTPDSITAFIGWLCDGQRNKIFDFLRTLKSRGESSNTFLSTVVCVLDDAYQNRLEGGDTPVNHFVIEKIARLNDDELESLIECLARGIDHSYNSSHTGVKMACVRALNYTVKK